MKKLPTSEKFFLKKAKELDSDPDDMPEWMIDAAIEFAKMHVKAALEKAYMDSELRISVEGDDLQYQDIYEDGTISITVSKKSIIDAYPENLIK